MGATRALASPTCILRRIDSLQTEHNIPSCSPSPSLFPSLSLSLSLPIAYSNSHFSRFVLHTAVQPSEEKLALWRLYDISVLKTPEREKGGGGLLNTHVVLALQKIQLTIGVQAPRSRKKKRASQCSTPCRATTTPTFGCLLFPSETTPRT